MNDFKMPNMEESKTVRRWLYSLRSRGMKLGLENMQRAMKILNLNNISIPSIQVAGTNGKGSVCAMIASIMRAAGKNVGLYTSPHLIDLKERININNIKINEAKLIKLVEEIKQKCEVESSPPLKLTFFEYITAVAMQYFTEKEVDIIVLETGLGGRFDATTAFDSSLAVITRIGIDHSDLLGNTIESIAKEKAGIIKRGTGVISSAMEKKANKIIREQANALECELLEQERDFGYSNLNTDSYETIFDYYGTRNLKDIKTNLLGKYQAENAATAIAASDFLVKENDFTIKDEHITVGLRNIEWHGRLEVISRNPLTIIDCAHNESAVYQTLESLRDLGKSPDTIIYASSKDKDYRSVASLLFPRAKRLVLTKYANERAIDPKILFRLAEANNESVHLTNSVSDAIEKARDITPNDETILIIGSIFLVGETLGIMKYGQQADLTMAGF